jgi:peptidoglycan glycosyltransferase
MNVPIMRLFGFFVLLFVVLVAWTSRWTVFDAKGLRDSALNKRPLFTALQVKRGSILAADGSVIARSVRGAGGTYRRLYPTGALFGHPVGYANVALAQLSGLERFRNDELSGQGSELDSIVTQLQGKRQQGDTVVTTLDPAAQRVATQQLQATGLRGSVVALDPRTGAVKVMASVPGYDPSDVGNRGRYRQLNRDPSSPLLNRATQATYPPGSTFKVLTAAAAIDSGRFTPDSTLNGDSPKKISGVDLSNDGDKSWGDISLTTALTFSVNTVFAQVGERLGLSTMADYMKRFGFYAKPPLDYPADQRIASGERLNGRRLLSPTSGLIDVGRMAIGQDKLTVTPLQMAMVVSAVANGGTLMTPHLTDRIVDPDGRTVTTISPRVMSRPIKPATASALNQMMRTVVEEGTGTAVQLPGIDVAGKTGTAEVGASGQNLTDPWFVAFAPATNPRIAIAVALESSQGGFGGTVAAPIARAVLQQLLH